MIKSYQTLCGIQEGYIQMLKFFVAKNEANIGKKKKTSGVHLENNTLSSSLTSQGKKKKDEEIIRY